MPLVLSNLSGSKQSDIGSGLGSIVNVTGSLSVGGTALAPTTLNTATAGTTGLVFFVSGASGDYGVRYGTGVQAGTDSRASGFGGDLMISGALTVAGGAYGPTGANKYTWASISGSIHKTQTGLDYIQGGNNISVTSASNGTILIDQIESGAGDVTGVTAGAGLQGGGNSGAVTLAISDIIVANKTGSNTWTGDNTFNGTNFNVTAGAGITVKTNTGNLMLHASGGNGAVIISGSNQYGPSIILKPGGNTAGYDTVDIYRGMTAGTYGMGEVYASFDPNDSTSYGDQAFAGGLMTLSGGILFTGDVSNTFPGNCAIMHPGFGIMMSATGSNGRLAFDYTGGGSIFSGTMQIGSNATKKLYFYKEGAQYIQGTESDLELSAVADINIPANVGLTFGNDGEIIEGDGTNLTIKGGDINLTAEDDVNLPASVGLTFGDDAEKIESNGTRLSIASGHGMIFDCEGAINIDSDQGTWLFNDDGVSILQTTGTTGTFNWTLPGTNQDMKFFVHAGTATATEVCRIDGGETALLMATTNKLMFRDSAIYIQSSADTQLDMVADGNINLTSTGDEAAAIYLRANGGTSETVKIHSDLGTSVTEGAASVTILSDAGGVELRSTANLANAINITNDGGATGTITIFNDQGTSVTEGSASVQLLSDDGGIGIKSTADLANAILLTADGGTSETIKIHADQSEVDGAAGAGAIELTSDAGGISLNAAAGKDIWAEAGRVILTANEDAASAVKIHADAGTAQTIVIVNDAGTSATEGAAAIQLLASAGGVNIKSGLDAASAILLTADGGTSETIKVHSDQGNTASSLHLLSDAGGITMDWADSKNLTVGNASASTGGYGIIPAVDNVLDLGSAAKRFANVYTGDLHLVNDRGNWTVIEESDSLTLRDNKTGKRFRLLMEELQPGEYDPDTDED